MAVYYKFKSAKDYDSIPIEGQFISVGNLKERIFESKHLGRGTDFDLMISNPQSNEEYVDEAAMIPKNTMVLIRRVPGCPRKPIVTEPFEPNKVEEKAKELPPQSSMLVGDSSTVKYPEESEWDEFGNDLYASPEVAPTQLSNPVVNVSATTMFDEEDKIKALIETPALDWSRQGQAGFGGGRGFGRGMGGRMMGGRGFGRGGFERKTPPVGYICHRCKVPGHLIQHCPTNGDPNYNVRKMKPPTGIPRSMLMATPDGSYALPSGAVAVLKPNEAAFEKEIEGLPSTRSVGDIPPELRCSLCKEVMKDAVLTSKCCFRSFCDKCIRDHIINKLMCVCGATNVLADDLLPNKTLRETIARLLESTTSSAENVGSQVQVPDMESARPLPPKVPSPVLSVVSKDEHKQIPPVEHSSDVKVGSVKEADAESEGKAVHDAMHSLEKKTLKKPDQSEATAESMSTKEPISPESAQVPEAAQEKILDGVQGRKKKKKKTPIPGSDMQWRGFQDLGAGNFVGMPQGPSAYDPYWGGGMPMGFDGFMPPFGGAMPYMGYVPGPFDVPFGGMMPPDPFAAQGYMMPPRPPRDLSELGFNSMNMPPMSRAQFEAMKADIRRKHEMERRNGRDHSRDGRGGIGKESGSGADGPSTKAKLRMGSSQAHREPSRYSSSPSPPPHLPAKRRSSERDRERGEEKKDEGSKKAKSVFARISFPESDQDSKRKGRAAASSSSDPNGAVKDAGHHRHHDHHHHHRSRRDGSVTSNGYKRSDSSDEDKEEEDYHFKRRPSRRHGGKEEEAAEEEEEGRFSRSSRDYERRRR